jgi:hypothetical protein
MTTSKRLLSLGRMAARAAAHQQQQRGQQQAGSALATSASSAAAASAARRAAAAAPSAAASVAVTASAATAAVGPSPRAFAAQAQAVEVQQQATQHRTATLTIPEVRADLFGAVSPVDPAADAAARLGAAAQPFENADGKRHEDGRYARFAEQIAAFIPKERVFTDPVRTFAYGTDASFYRLNPRMVVKVHDEAEVRKMLPIAKQLGVPVTFRAAGTSLSGQAITDSVLIKLSHTGRNFRNYDIHVSSFGFVVLRGGGLEKTMGGLFFAPMRAARERSRKKKTPPAQPKPPPKQPKQPTTKITTTTTGRRLLHHGRTGAHLGRSQPPVGHPPAQGKVSRAVQDGPRPF